MDDLKELALKEFQSVLSDHFLLSMLLMHLVISVNDTAKNSGEN
jgi:hypothetical protein